MTTTTQYFDLHITGLGYLNRVREVELKRGQNFLAVDISALHGATDAVDYTRFDCRVSGREAQQVFGQLTPAIEDRRAVLVGFKLGDLYAETFTYTQGDKAGQTGVSLKARLLRIAWAKVDGQTVYQAPLDKPAGSDAKADSDNPLDSVPPSCASAPVGQPIGALKASRERLAATSAS